MFSARCWCNYNSGQGSSGGGARRSLSFQQPESRGRGYADAPCAAQPPLALELARRNKLEHLLPFSTVEGAAKAYSHYDNLQQFLDLRDATLSVNVTCSQRPHEAVLMCTCNCDLSARAALYESDATF